MFKNTAAKFMVFAFDATTNLPKTGDAANLTAYVSKDYGAVTVLADTTATEMDATNAKGYYLFDAAQAETNADCLMVSAKSSTANIVVVGAPAVIYTRPTTGWLAPTTAARTLDVSAGGEAGLDWANVGSPTTTVDLSGTTIKTTQKVDVDTIKTNPVVNAGTITFPTTATLASTTNITAGTIATATNVTTVNGLAAGVITAASIAADAITDAKVASDVTIASVTGAVGSVTGAVGSVTGNVGGNVVGSVGSVTAAVTITAASVQAIWDALTSALTTVGSIGKLLVDNVNASISAIKAKTDNLPASPAAVGSAMTLTSGERDSIASAHLDLAAGVETGLTVRQGHRLTVAASAGKLSGAATTAIKIRDTGDTKDRISATVDSSGNRSAITLDVS